MLIVIQSIENPIVDKLQIGIQIFLSREMLVLVLLNAAFGKTFHLDPERQLVNKQFVKVLDPFKQMALGLWQIGTIGLMIGVNFLQRLDSQKPSVQHNDSFLMEMICKGSNFSAKYLTVQEI